MIKWWWHPIDKYGLPAATRTDRLFAATDFHHMSFLCKNHYLRQLYRKIDGALLWSQNERNLDCVITFQTDSILQRFMLRFDMLQLDCNDHLYADLTCRNTKQSVGAIFTRTNFVTLKYVTDNWGTDTNGFKLVITAIKDPKHSCKDFRCTLREFCIHPDLVCDGVNNCADGSDEAVGTLCPISDPYTILGLELTWIVLVAVSGLLVICACCVGLAICLCRRNTRPVVNQFGNMHPTIESNGSSKYMPGSTLPREITSLPPSGNWRHPAGPSGYLRIQLNLLMAIVRPICCPAN
uniref:Putative conserved plasma membrane protein n=1 Tax=Lutzomyia longipalpis TaxID=7200 RepID=A0A1B0CL85_LUTLO